MILSKPESETQERCGLILKDETILELQNIANDPITSYEIDPVAALPLLTSDIVAGTWHTHPFHEPNLSGEDYAGFLGWPELKHHIIGVVKGKVTVKTYEVKNGAIFECA